MMSLISTMLPTEMMNQISIFPIANANRTDRLVGVAPSI